MTPGDFLKDVLAPGLLWMEQNVGYMPPQSREARLLELAFAGQETKWQNIQQFGGGPGRGPWQFEPETCGLILRNPASSAMAHRVCAAIGIAPTQAAVYGALLKHPVEVAYSFARLDTWCDPRPLPPYGDAQAGWEAYDREWRPGRPRPLFWASVYAESLAADRVWSAGATHQGPTP